MALYLELQRNLAQQGTLLPIQHGDRLDHLPGALYRRLGGRLGFR